MHCLRFSKTEDARILALYKAGRTYLQIGQRHGRSKAVIYHRLIRLGAVRPHRPQRHSDSELARIDELRAAGLTGYRIAKLTGLPSATVYQRILLRPDRSGRHRRLAAGCEASG